MSQSIQLTQSSSALWIIVGAVHQKIYPLYTPENERNGYCYAGDHIFWAWGAIVLLFTADWVK